MGYGIAFIGTKGRRDAWIKQDPPWEQPRHDEICWTDGSGTAAVTRSSTTASSAIDAAYP